MRKAAGSRRFARATGKTAEDEDEDENEEDLRQQVSVVLAIVLSWLST
jgi:hypothetical protein